MSPGTQIYFRVHVFAEIVGGLADWSLVRSLDEANRTFDWLRREASSGEIWNAALSQEKFGWVDESRFRYGLFLPAIAEMCRRAGVTGHLGVALERARVFRADVGTVPTGWVFGNAEFWRKIGAALQSIEPTHLSVVVRMTLRGRAKRMGEPMEPVEQIAADVGLSVEAIREIYRETFLVLIRVLKEF